MYMYITTTKIISESRTLGQPISISNIFSNFRMVIKDICVNNYFTFYLLLRNRV